jgi:hypothetical protein
MNMTLVLKLVCSPETKKVLQDTISQFTDAFNRATKFGYDSKTTNGCTIHKARYREERNLTQRPSQLICAKNTPL